MAFFNQKNWKSEELKSSRIKRPLRQKLFQCLVCHEHNSHAGNYFVVLRHYPSVQATEAFSSDYVLKNPHYASVVHTCTSSCSFQLLSSSNKIQRESCCTLSRIQQKSELQFHSTMLCRFTYNQVVPHVPPTIHFLSIGLEPHNPGRGKLDSYTLEVSTLNSIFSQEKDHGEESKFINYFYQ